MCLGLLGDKAVVSIYDPQVRRDLAMNKFDWDHAHPRHLQPVGRGRARRAARHRHVGRVRGRDAHAVCILTEWDEFRSLDCWRMYNVMQKPAFVFAVAGFIIYAIGKPLDQAQWLKVMPAVA